MKMDKCPDCGRKMRVVGKVTHSYFCDHCHEEKKRKERRKMSNYVSLEMAKQLEGLFPESGKHWLCEWAQEPMLVRAEYAYKCVNTKNSDFRVPEDLCSFQDPSISELLERLPKNNDIASRHNFIICPYDDGFVIYFYDEKWEQHAFEDKSLPDALGKIFLHLYKEGVIK